MAVQYNVHDHRRRGTWVVGRRFTDFRILAKRLRQLGLIPPTVPPKQSLRNNTDVAFVSARVGQLQGFLDVCRVRTMRASCSQMHMYFLA
jgi:hypothetical protein